MENSRAPRTEPWKTCDREEVEPEKESLYVSEPTKTGGGLMPSHHCTDVVAVQLFIVKEDLTPIDNHLTGSAMSFCCCCDCSLWDDAVKAYQCTSEIVSVSHTDPADGTRKPSKMDISRLEEQYLCTKQKRKELAHIIVFKAGEKEMISAEPIMNTVPVNKTIRKPKAFKNHTPVRDVTLEVLNKNYLNDRDGTWHTHLNMHRMVQLDHHYALENGKADHEKEITHENNKPQFGKLLSYEDLTNKSDHLIKERKASSSSVERSTISNSNRKYSLKYAMTASWAQHHFAPLKLTSPTDKVSYYPFPQRKIPRISETARKLGLYVTH